MNYLQILNDHRDKSLIHFFEIDTMLGNLCNLRIKKESTKCKKDVISLILLNEHYLNVILIKHEGHVTSSSEHDIDKLLLYF